MTNGVYLKGFLFSQIYKYDAEQLLCVLQKAGKINLVYMYHIDLRNWNRKYAVLSDFQM